MKCLGLDLFYTIYISLLAQNLFSVREIWLLPSLQITNKAFLYFDHTLFISHLIYYSKDFYHTVNQTPHNCQSKAA